MGDGRAPYAAQPLSTDDASDERQTNKPDHVISFADFAEDLTVYARARAQRMQLHAAGCSIVNAHLHDLRRAAAAQRIDDFARLAATIKAELGGIIA